MVGFGFDVAMTGAVDVVVIFFLETLSLWIREKIQSVLLHVNMYPSSKVEV